VILPFVQALSTVLQVSIAGLKPPNGTIDQERLSEASWAPLNTTRWVLWLGAAAGPPDLFTGKPQRRRDACAPFGDNRGRL
jgi:hypothetical protein